MIKYNFTEKNILGTRTFLIDVDPPFEMLYDLSSGFLQTVEGIDSVLNNIKGVMNGEMEKYSFGGSDYCIVEVYKEQSVVFYDFGESQTEIPTSDLLRLLEDWKSYLIKEEKN